MSTVAACSNPLSGSPAFLRNPPRVDPRFGVRAIFVAPLLKITGDLPTGESRERVRRGRSNFSANGRNPRARRNFCSRPANEGAIGAGRSFVRGLNSHARRVAARAETCVSPLNCRSFSPATYARLAFHKSHSSKMHILDLLHGLHRRSFIEGLT